MPVNRWRWGALLVVLLVSLGAPVRAYDLSSAIMGASAAFGFPEAKSEDAAKGPTHDNGVIAAQLVTHAKRVRAQRKQDPHARSRLDEHALFLLRSSTHCLHALAQAGIRVARVASAITARMPTPVELQGPIHGVSFQVGPETDQHALSCELAARLAPLAAMLREHGVRAVAVQAFHREQSAVSFHTYGMALDISAFETDTGELSVIRDFERAPQAATCESTPKSERGRALLRIVCAIADSGLFSSVLTPNYGGTPLDHLHLDIRPNDPVVWVR